MILNEPIKALKESRGKSTKGYKITYDIDSWIQKNWRDHLLASRSRSKPVKEPWDCTIDYMGWLKKVTHPIVQNPKKFKWFGVECARSYGYFGRS